MKPRICGCLKYRRRSLVPFPLSRRSISNSSRHFLCWLKILYYRSAICTLAITFVVRRNGSFRRFSCGCVC
ncbi:hypothetical protein K449DRAFT_104226 [Hypoxylon sp. EC38]|nr:hypothetical protein K449DRAFT_104226 [Hypoxylon sp. EC38]